MKQTRQELAISRRKNIHLLEYGAVYAVVLLARALPLRALRGISTFLGNLMYLAVPRRRGIAVRNLRNAFKGSKSEREIKHLARSSCVSLFLTALETMKFHFCVPTPDTLARNGYTTEEMEGLERLLQKAKRLHDESGGCLFVTPHIGNWELLLYVSSLIGIPLAVVARPLDNAYIEDLLYNNRSAGGQILVPKKNAFFMLQKVLRQGKSIAMLPDQGTKRGISVDFFGHKATTTPVPALLAITYGRPIIVVACCRREEDGHFEGFVSDPILPDATAVEKAEIFRLTAEMNRQMEAIIRRFPGQYLWVHNRWKIYEDQTREFLS
jgi:KDO2-lipid IV(A) lauroyltransferase